LKTVRHKPILERFCKQATLFSIDTELRKQIWAIHPCQIPKREDCTTIKPFDCRSEVDPLAIQPVFEGGFNAEHGIFFSERILRCVQAD
uniref:DNA (cytosine-5-)-methyltransferase n=1 Tax=Haemonchus placei TaxID=6290 RepID=A0A0N4W3M6_HAEPC